MLHAKASTLEAESRGVLRVARIGGASDGIGRRGVDGEHVQLAAEQREHARVDGERRRGREKAAKPGAGWRRARRQRPRGNDVPRRTSCLLIGSFQTPVLCSNAVVSLALFLHRRPRWSSISWELSAVSLLCT